MCIDLSWHRNHLCLPTEARLNFAYHASLFNIEMHVSKL